MKKVFAAFLFLCVLTGCGPKPVPTTVALPAVLVASQATKIYEKAKPYVLVVEFYDEENKTWMLMGTAFLINFEGKQYIISAGHVYDPQLKMRIKTLDNKFFDIKSAKVSEKDDIAILAVENLNLKGGLELAPKNPVIGEDVFHIGNPLEVLWILTTGIVSQYQDGDLIASAHIAPGSSGGVLLNSKGQVVGIAVAVLPQWQMFNIFEPVESLRSFLK
jgi:S1-C subfamily serine protease